MQAEFSVPSLILNASWVVQLVMLGLLITSFFSWMVIYDKYKLLKRYKKASEAFEGRFWSGINLTDLYQALTRHEVPREGMDAVFESGFKEFARLRKQTGVEPRDMLDGATRAMRVTMAREVEVLEDRLAFLANVASVSPYVGLFGTVVGIMNSFLALSGVKSATLAMVAPGIAEALIATAMGLLAAIPAVVAFNRFADSVDRMGARYENFVEEFTAILRRQAYSPAKKTGSAA